METPSTTPTQESAGSYVQPDDVDRVCIKESSIKINYLHADMDDIAQAALDEGREVSHSWSSELEHYELLDYIYVSFAWPGWSLHQTLLLEPQSGHRCRANLGRLSRIINTL